MIDWKLTNKFGKVYQAQFDWDLGLEDAYMEGNTVQIYGNSVSIEPEIIAFTSDNQEELDNWTLRTLIDRKIARLEKEIEYLKSIRPAPIANNSNQLTLF